MSDTFQGWAAWHPKKGFDDELAVRVYEELDPILIANIKESNEWDHTTNHNGWRAVKVEVRKL